MRNLPSLAGMLAVCFSVSVACSDDDDDGGPSGMAGEGTGATSSSSGGEGTGATSSGGGETGDAGGGPGPSGCEPESVAETLVADIGAPTTWFAASEAGVAYVTRATAADTTDVMVLAAAAEEPELVYTSPEGSAVESIVWSGSELIFLEGEDGMVPTHLYRVPSTGGDAEQVGADTFSNGRLIGADASFAYLHNDATPGTIERVDLASGTTEVMGELAGGGILQPSLSGDELFFISGLPLQTVWRLPTDATEAEPEEVFVANASGGCGFPLGGLVATPTRLVCGYMNAFAYSRTDGAEEGQIAEGDRTRPAAHLPAASSGESVYFISENDGMSDAPLLRALSDGSDETAVICDMGDVADLLDDGVFPILNHPQIGVSGEHIYWVERRVDPATNEPTYSLRRAPL